MNLEWTRLALRDFAEAQDYIAKDNLLAAKAVAQRVGDAAKLLAENPKMGRDGHVAGTREWPVARTRYLIVYRIKGETLEILRVWHGRQDWQNQPQT